MLINNIDPLVTYNAKLIGRDIQTAKVITFKDWLRKGLNPIKEDQIEQYIPINLKFLIECPNDMQALTNISNLISNIKESTIKFEDIDYYYDVEITDKSTERFNEGAQGQFQLTVSLEAGYAYKAPVTETMNNIASKTINVPGNLPSPAIITITTSIDIGSVTVTGLGDSFTINNLTSGQAVTIDGESGLVTNADGSNKFADWDGWEFPILQPGNNIITVNNTNCTVQIQYKPKWI